MLTPTQPCAWANFLVKAWGDRFPVRVPIIALEYTRAFSGPIKAIKSTSSNCFEGALYPLRNIGQWAILYNSNIASNGRKNFTLAHEFGHYLLHRTQFGDGLECGEAHILGYDNDPTRRKIEAEADTFASYLLMPMDDFRVQIADMDMSLELLKHCAERYDVSLTAAAIKWLDFTDKIAVLIVATNGHVLWCWRSQQGKLERIFFRQGMQIPPTSLAANPHLIVPSTGLQLPPQVWGVSCDSREIAIFADRYEMTISLLILDKPKANVWHQCNSSK